MTPSILLGDGEGSGEALLVLCEIV